MLNNNYLTFIKEYRRYAILKLGRSNFLKKEQEKPKNKGNRFKRLK